jgi:hypothetical protein
LGFLDGSLHRPLFILLDVIPIFAGQCHWPRNLWMHKVAMAAFPAAVREAGAFQVAD